MKIKIPFFIILSIFINGCANFNSFGTKQEFAVSDNQCSTFKISGDNMIYKNLSIYAQDGFLYIKAPKLPDASTIRVYAVAKDNSLGIIRYEVINSEKDYTYFKVNEGFSSYAIKGDAGGVVYLTCAQQSHQSY